MKDDIEDYFEREVIPFAPDAWMERSKDKVGCEFPFTKLFYIYKPLRSSEAIMKELEDLEKSTMGEIANLRSE